jgi:hypothetical protein
MSLGSSFLPSVDYLFSSRIARLTPDQNFRRSLSLSRRGSETVKRTQPNPGQEAQDLAQREPENHRDPERVRRLPERGPGGNGERRGPVPGTGRGAGQLDRAAGGLGARVALPSEEKGLRAVR